MDTAKPSAETSGARTPPLLVHVQESAGSLDVFIVTEQRLRPVLERRAHLRKDLEISYGATRTELDRGLETAEVLLVGNFASDPYSPASKNSFQRFPTVSC